MDTIKIMVGIDVYSIICSYTNIELLFYKNEICITPHIIYNNYKLAIYLDNINSPDIERVYDHECELQLDELEIDYNDLGLVLTCIYGEFSIITYYKEYIILKSNYNYNYKTYDYYKSYSHTKDITAIIIYNIKKRYGLYIRPLYENNKQRWSFKKYIVKLPMPEYIFSIPITPFDIIKYFKLNPLEMKNCNISIKYICNKTYKYMVLNHNHNCHAECDVCQSSCNDIHYNCSGLRLMLINYKTYEIDILKCSNDCGL